MSAVLQPIDPSTDLAARYRAVRDATMALTRPLSDEDCVVQSMPDCSPAKWHLAHTTWFFETFILEAQAGYRPYAPAYRVLFNSYYQSVGAQHARPRRGLLTRPSRAEVTAYRAAIDEQMDALLRRGVAREVAAIVELGLHHEQQHQELLLTDIKHLFGCNPLRPAYRTTETVIADGVAPPLSWHAYPGGLAQFGHDGEGFAFDNEGPRHRAYLHPYTLASRAVTNAEFLAFIDEGGYEQPKYWLSAGWDIVNAQGWRAPLYWEQRDGQWWQHTLYGLRPVAPHEPVCHISYYEADAYARYAGARLPTEYEWEAAAAGADMAGNFVESGALHPRAASAQGQADTPLQLYGDVWEWTASAYAPYPGYAPAQGALGEYNGKFMCSQQVLRGGSCVTPASHIRATYRNFFPPDARWQFSGIRLARDL
ncbi:MAG TPA: ergothioneine biosynthesis protein EgtB [Burkholderiales bacterium]|nr:ergothioneine biosynthesis protein EgtB [Burkholderiales bacterium]